MKGLRFHKIDRSGCSGCRDRVAVVSPRLGGIALSTAMALFLAVLGAFVSGISCHSSPAAIPIGVYLPLTGQEAGFGGSIKTGIEMAVLEVNSSGGIKGKLLEVTVVDDGGDPERSRDAVYRLIETNGVAAILGGALSAGSLAGAPVCQEQGVPMVSPSSTNPDVTKVGDYIIRVCYVDSFQGTAMATFAYTSLRLKKIAIMSKKEDRYSEGLADYFARTFRELGGEVTGNEDFTENSLVLSQRLSALEAAVPDALFLPLYYQDVSLAAVTAAARGGIPLLLGGDGWDSPEVLRLAGDAVDGCYFTTHYSAEDRRTKVRTFVRSYRETFNATPDALAALGYDATHLVAAALTRLSDRAPKAFEALAWRGGGGGGMEELRGARRLLRDIICETEDFEGVTGEVRIDESRNAVKPAVVLQIKGGAFHYAGVVRP